MRDVPDRRQVTITIVAGSQGPEFDQKQLHLPLGATTVWVNRTETAQVILPVMEGTRRTMRLAPAGQEGAVWVMQMRSSQQPARSGPFGWRLQSNEAAHITIVIGIESLDARD